MLEPTRDMPDDPAQRERLRKKLEEIDRVYLERIRKGETPDRGLLLASDPELADSIEEHLDLLDTLHRIRPDRPFPEREGAGHADPGAAGAGVLDADAGRVGPYLLRSVLGEGGMGIVHLAEQTDPVRRPVALKVLKPGLVSDDVIARFESERQALALMEHAGIARVFDGGVTASGRPYFVMEYVQGVPITEYCDAGRLGTNERLELFLEVCSAVQHAHQKGVIHRDLKPSNILVTEDTGRAVSKIIDFGVAKAIRRRLTDRNVFTEKGRIFGTVGYMSPEQAGGDPELVDTRSDIYSLGVILYELLVGASPFDEGEIGSGGLEEICRKIRQEDPPRPSTRVFSLGEAAKGPAKMRRTSPEILARRLRGDLDWITMRAMEKDPARRYASASELAADIARHLGDEPVLAGPPTTWYRIRKFVRKHRAGVTAGLAAGGMLVAGLIVSSLLYFRAAAERDRAEEATRAEALQREEARRQAKRAEDVSRSLHRLIASVNPMHNEGDVGLSSLLDRAVADMESDPPEDPLVEASLRRTIGESYLGVGLFERAEENLGRSREILGEILGEDHRETMLARLLWGHAMVYGGNAADAPTILRTVLEDLERETGPDDPATLGAVHYLARAVAREGKVAQAESLYRRALEGRRRVLGESHQDTLATMEHLADLLQRAGRLDEAEGLLRRVIEIREGQRGEEHPLLIQSRGSLAVILQEKGMWNEAEDSLREVLDASRRILGEDHPYTLHWMTNLSRVLVGQGGLEEAESLARQVLDVKRRRSGDDHPSTLESFNNLAIVLQKRGKTSEAEKLQMRALSGQRRVLGEDHPCTLRSMGNIGLFLMEQERFEEAEPLLRRSFEGLRRTLGEEHSESFRSAHHLAYVLHALGRWEESEGLYRRALEVHERVLGADHVDTIYVKDNLGILLTDRGEYAEAEGYLREAAEGCRSRLGEGHPDTLRVTYHLAVVLRHLGRLEEAEALARRAAGGLRQILGDGHPDSLKSMALLAGLLQDRSDLEAAERLWRRVVEIARSNLPQGDRITADFDGSYGSCLMEMERRDTAEEHLLRSYGALREGLGPDHEQTRVALRRLVELYTAWGKGEQAEKYLSRLSSRPAQPE